MRAQNCYIIYYMHLNDNTQTQKSTGSTRTKSFEKSKRARQCQEKSAKNNTRYNFEIDALYALENNKLLNKTVKHNLLQRKPDK